MWPKEETWTEDPLPRFNLVSQWISFPQLWRAAVMGHGELLQTSHGLFCFHGKTTSSYKPACWPILFSSLQINSVAHVVSLYQSRSWQLFSLTTSWSAWIPWMLVSLTCCMRRLRKMHLRKVPFGPLVCNSWVVWSCGLRTYSDNIRYMQHKPQRNINCRDLRPDNGHSQVDYSHDPFLTKAVWALRCVTIDNYQEWCIAQSR